MTIESLLGMVKRYRFRLKGQIIVFAEDEDEAMEEAAEKLSEEPYEYLDLIKVEEPPKCIMSPKCLFFRTMWNHLSEEARKANPAGCIFYENGYCLNENRDE